jgi:RimJ/RimL family protein N-acetyltransferase
LQTEYSFEPTRVDDGVTFHAWAAGDAATRQYLDFDTPWEQYFAYVQGNADYFLYTVCLGGEIVGELGFQIADGEWFIFILVAPELRKCGHGLAILREFVSRAAQITGREIREIRADIAPTNAASIRIAELCGFAHVGTDADGFREYSYKME